MNRKNKPSQGVSRRQVLGTGLGTLATVFIGLRFFSPRTLQRVADILHDTIDGESIDNDPIQVISSELTELISHTQSPEQAENERLQARVASLESYIASFDPHTREIMDSHHRTLDEQSFNRAHADFEGNGPFIYQILDVLDSSMESTLDVLSQEDKWLVAMLIVHGLITAETSWNMYECPLGRRFRARCASGDLVVSESGPADYAANSSVDWGLFQINWGDREDWQTEELVNDPLGAAAITVTYLNRTLNSTKQRDGGGTRLYERIQELQDTFGLSNQDLMIPFLLFGHNIGPRGTSNVVAYFTENWTEEDIRVELGEGPYGMRLFTLMTEWVAEHNESAPYSSVVNTFKNSHPTYVHNIWARVLSIIPYERVYLEEANLDN